MHLCVLHCFPKTPPPCPRPLQPHQGGTPCLRLEVKGDSFMLNQIR
jgi:hypothetical protein